MPGDDRRIPVPPPPGTPGGPSDAPPPRDPLDDPDPLDKESEWGDLEIIDDADQPDLWEDLDELDEEDEEVEIIEDGVETADLLEVEDLTAEDDPVEDVDDDADGVLDEEDWDDSWFAGEVEPDPEEDDRVILSWSLTVKVEDTSLPGLLDPTQERTVLTHPDPAPFAGRELRIVLGPLELVRSVLVERGDPAQLRVGRDCLGDQVLISSE